ncbi:MAG: CRTAC1 family protein [Phycisphaerales bacterium]|nr:CRTAC1 family protein [Phycisphaerales bacterium]
MISLCPLMVGCVEEPADHGTQLKPTSEPDIWLRDDSALSNVNVVWESGATGEYYMPEIIGGGGGLFDADGDGSLDLYIVQGGRLTPEGIQDDGPPNRFFLNNGMGVFNEVNCGAEDTGYGMGVAAGDIDNDGDVDLYVLNLGPNSMYLNDGKGAFTNVTASSGTGDPDWGSSGTFLDYDRDGDLDLYVTNYLMWSPQTALNCVSGNGMPDYCSPEHFMAPAIDRLYRNDGNGQFTDVTVESGIVTKPGTGLGVVAADFDQDGWIDVFVANDLMPDHLWHNRGDGTFEEIGLATGCAMDDTGRPKAGMGVDANDIDDDGDLDLIVCNLKSESDSLFRNDGDYFVDITTQSGLRNATRAWTRFGLGLVDFNNDGWLDLYEANGAVLRPSQPISGDPYAQQNMLLRGAPDIQFTPVSPRGGTLPLKPLTSRAAIFGDIDNDGRRDVVVVNRDGPVRVYRNTCSIAAQSITLDVRNRHGAPALGAIVTAQLGKRTITRPVKSGWSYMAANDPTVHVGMEDESVLKDVRVRWTNGTVTPYGDLKANRRHRLTQPEE